MNDLLDLARQTLGWAERMRDRAVRDRRWAAVKQYNRRMNEAAHLVRTLEAGAMNGGEA